LYAFYVIKIIRQMTQQRNDRVAAPVES